MKAGCPESMYQRLGEGFVIATIRRKMQTIVYKYSIYPRDEQTLKSILWTSNQYYNRLIENERTCRGLYAQTRREMYPEYEQLENERDELLAEIDEYREAINKSRASSRKRNEDEAHATAKKSISELKLRLDPINKKLFDLRNSINGGAPYIKVSEKLREVEKEFKKSKNTDLKSAIESLKAERKAIVSQTPLGKRQAELNQKRKELFAEVSDMAEVPKGKYAKPKWVSDLHLRRDAGKMGLWSGQYALCEEAATQAGKSKSDPKFRKFTGGRAGVGSKGGWNAPIAGVLEGSDGMMRILRSERLTGKNWQTLAFKIGSRKNENGAIEPVWTMCDLSMHRPMPHDAVLLRAAIVGKVNSLGKWKWSLSITLQTNVSRHQEPISGRCEASLCWTKVQGIGIKISHIDTESPITVSNETRDWVANCDGGADIIVPERVIDLKSKAESIRGFNDRHFADALGKGNEDQPASAFLEFVKLNDTPMWIKVDAEFAHLWQSPAKLEAISRRIADKFLGENRTKMTERWREYCKHNRKDFYPCFVECKIWALDHLGVSERDAIAFALEQWRLKYRHLKQWELGLLERFQNARKDAFRKVARALANSHREIVISNINIAELAKLEDSESEQANALSAPQRYQRVVAAPGEFRSALVLAFGDDRSSLADLSKRTGRARKAAA